MNIKTAVRIRRRFEAHIDRSKQAQSLFQADIKEERRRADDVCSELVFTVRQEADPEKLLVERVDKSWGILISRGSGM